MQTIINQSKNLTSKIVLITLLIIGAIITGIKCADQSDQPSTLLTSLEARTNNQNQPPAQFMVPDTSYRPIAWGAELRVIPGIGVKQSYHKKFGDYWFSKVMAYQIVKPARYLQDSTWERVAFADSTAFGQNDTFYICRRIIK